MSSETVTVDLVPVEDAAEAHIIPVEILETLPLDASGICVLEDGTVTLHGVVITAAAEPETAEPAAAEPDILTRSFGTRAGAGSATASTAPSVYYVDPARGSMSNSGRSLTSPWSTLAAVLETKKPLVGGDVLVLLRGYHGAPLITGVNASDVIIRAMPGHSPAVRSLTFTKASRWDVGGLTVFVGTTPPGHPDATRGARGVDLSLSQSDESCSFITVRDTAIYAAQGRLGCASGASAGMRVYATNYSIINCNIANGGGLQLGYHSSGGRVIDCVIENFCGDGSGLRANNILLQGNFIYGSHKINGNHNDLFQSWAATNIILRNNFLAAYANPNQPFLYKPGVSDAQGMGCFDGWKRNWVIQGNVVLVDHPIGIWLLGYQGATVMHNTVVRCGTSGLYNSRRPPCIQLAPSKSGAASSGGIVANNLCENYELLSGVAQATNNMKVSSSEFGAMFVSIVRRDYRLKAGARAVGAGARAGVLPPTAFAAAGSDARGTPYVDAVTGAVDCGAFSAKSSTLTTPWAMAPAAPAARPVLAAVPIPGTGIDIAWRTLPGDKSFDITVDGVRVGTTRTGTGTFLWVDPSRGSGAAVALSRIAVTAVSTVSF
jgi:hypothetical protein